MVTPRAAPRLAGFGDTTARIRPVFHGDASKTKDGHGISRRVDPGTVRAAAPAAPGGLGSATFDPDPQILNAAASR